MSTITLNGEELEFSEGTSLTELLTSLDLPDARIAVELNKTVIRRKDWDETRLSDEDVLEIVHFVGGG